MQKNYQVRGPERKDMAKAIAEEINEEIIYSGVPKCEYQIGPFTITKEGVLIWDDETDGDEVVFALAEKGWIANADVMDSISIPRELLDEAALDRLKGLIEAKGTLMKHAFKTENLKLVMDEEKISFPWFNLDGEPARTNAYMQFIQALCNIATKQKRVLAKEKDVENEKYAFRCFLLRLGFIGKEYKATRKILMENLTGSSAFRIVKEAGEVDA